MLWAAVAYSLGVVAGVYLWRPVLWWTVAAAAFAAAAAYFAGRRSTLGWLLALGAVFLSGALHIETRGRSTHFDTRIQPYADREELQIVAHVTHDGRLQPAASMKSGRRLTSKPKKSSQQQASRKQGRQQERPKRSIPASA